MQNIPLKFFIKLLINLKKDLDKHNKYYEEFKKVSIESLNKAKSGSKESVCSSVFNQFFYLSFY